MKGTVPRRILREVLSLPTAPFAEHAVLDYIRAFAAKRGLDLRSDRAGNILIHYRRGSKRVDRPVCLTAHVDHPGFVAEKMLSHDRLRARWRGGVAPEYFVGAKVRFCTGGRWVKGRVRSIVTAKKGTRVLVDTADIEVTGDVTAQSPGMWDFPDPVIRGHRIHARAIDDLGGVAAMLGSLHDVHAGRARGEAYFLFTRAEEVGFIGAMAACRLKTIPKRCVVVAVETSSLRPNAQPGDGPILRVGDKATTFTSAATSFCGGVATDLVENGKGFMYQRRLMDGGTCESSAYCQLGYDATGVCLALGHYHNMNTRTKKTAPEFIDLRDYDHLVAWFVALVKTKRRYTGRDEALGDMLARLQETFNPLLESTARPCQRRGA